MRTRHKIPAVFSIYMVDVLCCALGCVILLWQLYHQDSEEQTRENAIKSAENAAIRKLLEESNVDRESLNANLLASQKKESNLKLELADTGKERDQAIQTSSKLAAELKDKTKEMNQAVQLALVNKQKYDDTRRKLNAAQLQHDETKRKLEDAQLKYDLAKTTLASAEAMISLLRLDVKNLEKKNTLTAEELANKIRAHADLFDKLAAAEKKLRALTTDLALKEADTRLASKRASEKADLLKSLEDELTLLRGQNKDTKAKLTTADLRAKLLEQDLERGKKELLDVNRRFSELTAVQDSLSKSVTIKVKDLEAAKLALAALERDKGSLLRKAAAAENRFAGITLTGKRVMFLVDMSGSMEMVDENTFDPDKWPIVCETVARIMRSLPDLREYQVIVFSDRFRYAFGNDGRWVTYDPEVSPKKVADGLKAIKPKGGTSMYTAFEEAFRYREAGLDTIYFFSDGLPNIGAGLPADAAKLTESQRGEILAKHIRAKLKNTWNRPIPGQARVRINCIGFFFESPDLGAFLWALAREHDGSFVGMSRP